MLYIFDEKKATKIPLINKINYFKVVALKNHTFVYKSEMRASFKLIVKAIKSTLKAVYNSFDFFEKPSQRRLYDLCY